MQNTGIQLDTGKLLKYSDMLKVHGNAPLYFFNNANFL